MPPKKGGKKGGKKKGPAYMTHEDGVDHCAPFGFAPGDMIHTPLGLRACVLGVKYASPEDLGGGVLWVKYDGPLEKEAPIENPSAMSGYVRAPRDRAPVAGGGPAERGRGGQSGEATHREREEKRGGGFGGCEDRVVGAEKTRRREEERGRRRVRGQQGERVIS